jgi:3-hydroxybutyryl-CoA dehydratase
MPNQAVHEDSHDHIGDSLADLVDQQTRFRKTVAESDVYLFAGITGDLSENHVDQQAMQGTEYGERIAHGMLVLSFMSTGSTRLIERVGGLAVSYGYDHVRFVAPVRFGDTITVHYRVTGVDIDRSRSFADVRVTNQHGEVVAVAQHILAWRERHQSSVGVRAPKPKSTDAPDLGGVPSDDPARS